MLDPKALRLAIALADIRGPMDFQTSLGYWLRGAHEPTDDWVGSLWPHTAPASGLQRSTANAELTTGSSKKRYV
jgi:hypothetical protein